MWPQSNIGRAVPVVPHVPGDTVIVDSSISGKASANNAKATLRRVAEQFAKACK